MPVRLIAALLFTAVLGYGQLPRPSDSEPPANTSGIAPRSNPADYPVHEAAPGITVAATVLTPAQVKKLFPMNLDSAGYVVVEVGIFPEKDNQVTVDTDQFRLQVGNDRTMRRPVSPNEIMADRGRGNKPHQPLAIPGNVPVSTTTTIGYESGGPYNRGGVYGGASTTVGTPGSSPYPYPDPRTASPKGNDPAETERDLVDKELAMGKTTVPVAGYLYFPKPRQKQKNPSFDLTYRGAGATVHLAIPASK
ncbi:MAG TPA: hypothetical protein VG456_11570 [Candidatus Sulfopaludibacter sp.]|jgi:hypothetical protein|nr:hypothetical protein [Candidatus Sulfopaludibacter sp.]